MQRNKSALMMTAALLVIALLAPRVCLAQAAAAATGKEALIANLTAAFNGESNARAKYEAFAAQADKDGYAPVASLFRAAAKAEGIHAASHEKVLAGLGVQAKAELKAIEVKSTRENLEAALAGEQYERDKMYPQFIKQAREQNESAAVRTFTLAKTAEAEHAKLYEAALKDLDVRWKGSGRKTFYVCGVCGYTVTQLPAKRCVSCREPVEEYQVVD